tara:strand:+ start:16724 stop:17986 length:1263 start_codon:yes stop_codon:yes gene_type:complete
MIKVKKTIVIYIVLVLPIIVDLINGINQKYGLGLPSLSAIFRGGVVLISFMLLLTKPRTQYVVCIYGLFILWLVSCVVWATYSGHFNLFAEVNVFFKVTYIFFVLIILSRLELDADFALYHVKKSLIWFSFIAALALIFSFVTGLGEATYGDYAFGTSSFFISSNGLSISLLLGLCFSWSEVLKEPNIKAVTLALVSFLGIFMIGTMTAMVGGFLVVLVYLIFFLIFFKPNFLWQKIFKNLLATVGILIIIFSGYQVFQLLSEYSYYVEKVEKILTQGPRARLINAAERHFVKRNDIHTFFGEGMYSYAKNYSVMDPAKNFSEEGYAMTEVDHYDIFGGYGLLFGGGILGAYLIWFLLSIRNWFKRPSMESFTIFYSTLLVIIHALAAGHVILNPLVTGIFSGIVFLTLITMRKTKKYVP